MAGLTDTEMVEILGHQPARHGEELTKAGLAEIPAEDGLHPDRRAEGREAQEEVQHDGPGLVVWAPS